MDRTESQEDVEIFLRTVRTTLSLPDSLRIQRIRRGEDPTDSYTTNNTLADLEFSVEDVRNELLTLLPRHYIKTSDDTKRDAKSPPFWIFEKSIKSKSMYIKIKLINEKLVFCMSFHYPRYPITDNDKPYA
jgi:hypothetical protein